jgi:hypothetical protein
MLTCQQAKVAYKHVLEVVFQLNDNDPLYKALDTRGYDDVRQLLTMSVKDIDVLTYPDSRAPMYLFLPLVRFGFTS